MKSSWQSPSNIALVKYWGKHGRQLPRNPSISFTLSQARTETHVVANARERGENVALSFVFEGQPNAAFEKKLIKLLSGVLEELPFMRDFHLSISSSNSFPHSAGIASSASSMSALALCLCDIEAQLMGNAAEGEAFLQKASNISRLLSGSACRSVYPWMGEWGVCGTMEGSSDLHATPFVPHDIFKSFHDDILIISASEKSVSSTAGHGLMEGNPYAEARYQQANRHLDGLLVALKEGDLETFGRITEDEALTLHALMMASSPSYILMEAGSLEAIQRVRKFRQETGLPLYFTLDAGPNLHLLYPDSIAAEVAAFIETDLRVLCEKGRVIKDFVGLGAGKIEE